MSSKNKKQSLLWTSLAAFAVACGGGALSQKLDGGQTTADVGLKVQANSTAQTAALVNALVEGTNLTVESGQACIEQIRLKLPEGLSCADVGFVEQTNVICEEELEEEDGGQQIEAKIKISGPFLFNLVTGASEPSLADVKIPSGVYRKIEFRFGPACDLGGETTLTMNGTMLDSSSTAHPFEMELEYDDELEIESPTDVQVLEEQANGIFANLVIDNWFAAVDFVGCIDSGDLVETAGVIQITPTAVHTGECENIHDDLVDAIKEALEFEDSDHDDDGIDDSDDSDDDNDGVDDNEDNHDTDPNHD